MDISFISIVANTIKSYKYQINTIGSYSCKNLQIQTEFYHTFKINYHALAMVGVIHPFLQVRLHPTTTHFHWITLIIIIASSLFKFSTPPNFRFIIYYYGIFYNKLPPRTYSITTSVTILHTIILLKLKCLFRLCLDCVLLVCCFWCSRC